MSVLAPTARVLFCEGKPQSLDAALLNRLVEGNATMPTIVPVGGKYGLKSFASGWRAGGKSPGNQIAFRDRDFDAEPGIEIQLIEEPNGGPTSSLKVYLTHRAAIETYLLDADLIHQYWDECHRLGHNWKHGPSDGRDAISQWMEDAAQSVVFYQASRWALASLKPGRRWPILETKWTGASGMLPDSLTENECWESARKLVEEFGTVAGSVSESRLREAFDRFKAQFQAPAFFASQQYMVWFHGKDLLKAMQRMKLNLFGLERSFLPWAVERLAWRAHLDLCQLSELLS